MEESVKIAIDIMGGDKSPDKNLEGINLFLKRNKNIKDVFFHIYGDEIQIKSKIGNFEYLKNNYNITRYLFLYVLVFCSDIHNLNNLYNFLNYLYLYRL